MYTSLLTVTDPGNHSFYYTSDSTTGNLLKYADQLGDSWQYTWKNNNLTSSQDANGTASYQYDSRGNVTSETTTVDSNSANDITKTMTYDNNNQLLKVVDGGGRTIDYQYDNKGNLLSTINPNVKTSNGKLYDQYGNIVQSSPAISASQNLLKNGSFETGGLGGTGDLTNWTHVPGNATVTTPKGENNTHGNYDLKMSSISGATTDWYYQRVSGLTYGVKLTLRADVHLDNVQNSGNYEGATIKLDYGGGNYDSWSVSGSGSVPLIVTSQSASSMVDVYIGFNNTSGTAWFDGVQLENAHYSSDGYKLSAFSSAENGGFENGLYKWNNTLGSFGSVTTEAAWEGYNSVKLTLTTSGTASIYQDVLWALTSINIK